MTRLCQLPRRRPATGRLAIALPRSLAGPLGRTLLGLSLAERLRNKIPPFRLMTQRRNVENSPETRHDEATRPPGRPSDCNAVTISCRARCAIAAIISQLQPLAPPTGLAAAPNERERPWRSALSAAGTCQILARVRLSLTVTLPQWRSRAPPNAPRQLQRGPTAASSASARRATKLGNAS